MEIVQNTARRQKVEGAQAFFYGFQHEDFKKKNHHDEISVKDCIHPLWPSSKIKSFVKFDYHICGGEINVITYLLLSIHWKQNLLAYNYECNSSWEIILPHSPSHVSFRVLYPRSPKKSGYLVWYSCKNGIYHVEYSIQVLWDDWV